MKNTKKTEFPMPKLRVSHKVYIRVMEAALDESLTLDPEMGFELMCAVRSYLHTQRNAPIGRDRIYKIFRRYREIIDAAAERSARARAAAQRRRESREAARKSRDDTKPQNPAIPTEPITTDTGEQPQCRDMPPACLRTTPGQTYPAH